MGNAPTPDQAYAKAMQVLDDLQVAVTTPGVTLDVEHAEIRLKLASQYVDLAASLRFTERLDED